MDSMRHLSTSLPSTRRRQDQPELLGDFRAAALSVTNLYKSAAASQDRARAAGYQDALDDLLAFLDRENLGLMDGEGWRVRQWATERLDDGAQKPAASDDEEEPVQEEQKKPAAVPVPSSEPTDAAVAPRRTAVSEPPQAPLQAQTPPPPSHANPYASVPSIDDFTFRSSHAYPTNHDRGQTQQQSMDLDATTPTTSTPPSTESVRIISRPARGRHSNHQRQRLNGTSAVSLNLAGAAGSKRKWPYQDFFDISGLNGLDGKDGKEGGGGGGRGGKRGRHV